jgi:hypothetical protein
MTFVGKLTSKGLDVRLHAIRNSPPFESEFAHAQNSLSFWEKRGFFIIGEVTEYRS